MPPSLAPAPFYGDNLVSLDAVRRIRFSRLFDSNSTAISPDEKPRKSISPRANPRFKGVKLFANISHGVKKAKPKKPPPLKKVAVQKVAKQVSVREKIRDKFDFSRTPYSLTFKKPRVMLTEEMSKNRKFFKSSIETPETKKPVVEKNPTLMEFEDLNDPEEEPFAEIKKGVTSIIHQINWFDDEDDYLKPQVTRQVADESLNPITTPNKSYITLTSLSPRTPISSNVVKAPLQTPTILNIANQENSPSISVTSTPTTILGTPTSTTIMGTPTSTTIMGTPTSTTIMGTPSSTTVMGTPTSISVTSTPKTHLSTSTPEQTPNSNQSKKLFPLFTPSSAKNVLSDVTNKNKKQRKVLNKAAAPNDQYQIDAGQKVIGPKQCPSCGMVFDIGDPVDQENHDKFHNKRKDIKFKIPSAQLDKFVVYRCGPDQTDLIILVKHSDDARKRNKVIDILKITEEEIGTGYAFEPSFMAFLYIRHETVLGCLIAEPSVNASRIIHSDGIVLLSEDKQSVKCGVNRIWVKSEFRGQRIATELINCLRKNFVFGEILDVNDIAFSPTTPDGDAFAIKYCGREDYLSYVGAYE